MTTPTMDRETPTIRINRRARSSTEAQPWLGTTAGVMALVTVVVARMLQRDPFLESGAGVWAVLLVGLVVVQAAGVMASEWSRRWVLPVRTVPVLLGLAFLSPFTLVLVTLSAVAVSTFVLRPDRPMRNITEATCGALTAGMAMAIFRAAAAPADAFAPGTWFALALAGTFLALFDIATEALLRASAVEGRVRPDGPLMPSAHDLLVLGLGLVIGISAVMAGRVHDIGALVGVVGTLALVALSLHHALDRRREIDDHHVKVLQDTLIHGVSDNTVARLAACTLRQPLDALAVGVVEPEGAHHVAAEQDHTVEDGLGPLQGIVESMAGGVQHLTVDASVLGTIAEELGLPTRVHLLLAQAPWPGGASGLLYAIRDADQASSFGPSERSLLFLAAKETGQSLASARRLARLERHAMFDELTGLPNRVHIEESITSAVATSAARGSTPAVLLVDLNGFKEVNDTLGHQMGDDVLAEVGQRLASLGGRVDEVGRLGGDEFAILLSAPTSAEVTAAADALAAEVAEAIARPVTHGDLVLDLSVSIGMARFPEHGDGPEELIRAADVAMYAAKGRGIPYLVYEGKLDRHRTRRLGLATDLRAALAEQALEVRFQPKVRFATGELIGAEALIRWSHPTLGFIPAGEIILIAEHAGLLRELTDFVLDRSGAHCATMQAEGFEFTVAVNLTERDIADVELPERIQAVIDAHGLAPGSISVEVTETALLTQEVEALGVLPRVADMGVQLAIDDFGTGFSSLSHLRKFPVNEIKIDMSFVDRMVIRPNDAVIVRSIVDLGHSLGMRVVAEGVETNEAWAMLEEFGTDVAQGNHVMKAIDAQSFVSWAIFWDQYREARGRGSNPPSRPGDLDDVIAVQLESLRTTDAQQAEVSDS